MKKTFIILPLALLLCFTVGCQDKEAMAELEEFRAQAKVEEQNEALVKRFYGEMNKANIEGLKELVAPSFAQHQPSESKNPMSRDEWLEAMQNVYIAFPDFHYDIRDIIAKGDVVTVRTLIKATHKGDWYGIPATGNEIEFSEIFIIRIQDAKIAKEWGVTDSLGAYMQLGMELKPKEEK